MILNNRQKWNAASNAEREVVVQQLLEAELKGHFEYLEMKTYSCGGLANIVALFRHLSTDMLFHLLPGEPEYFAGASAEQISVIQKEYSTDLSEYFNESIEIKPFLISRYLITEEAWAKFGGKPLYRNFGPKHPIDAVEREDVEKWAAPLGLKLPSEMEWEYACKAGIQKIFYWGNIPNLSYAWTNENTDFSESYHTLTEAEQKSGNAFGLLGMIGNLGEWVADDAHDDYDVGQEAYRNEEHPNPDGILRGGWNNYGWNFNRSTSRVQCGGADTGCSARMVFVIEIKEKEILKNVLSEQQSSPQSRPTPKPEKKVDPKAEMAWKRLCLSMKTRKISSKKYHRKQKSWTVYRAPLAYLEHLCTPDYLRERPISVKEIRDIYERRCDLIDQDLGLNSGEALAIWIRYCQGDISEKIPGIIYWSFVELFHKEELSINASETLLAALETLPYTRPFYIGEEVNLPVVEGLPKVLSILQEDLADVYAALVAKNISANDLQAFTTWKAYAEVYEQGILMYYY
jgi:hypothetical protein